MDSKEKNKLIMELFSGNGHIVIIPSKVAGVDALCAAAGLYRVFKDQDKNVSLLYPGKLPENALGVIDETEITQNWEGKDLIISIDYETLGARHVQYNTQDGTFNLRMGPVSKDFDIAKGVKVELKQHSHDIFITLGAQEWDDFGPLYDELYKDLKEGKVINLDIKSKNSRFGHFNFVDPLVHSLSQLSMEMVAAWNMELSQEAIAAFSTGITSKN